MGNALGMFQNVSFTLPLPEKKRMSFSWLLTKGNWFGFQRKIPRMCDGPVRLFLPGISQSKASPCLASSTSSKLPFNAPMCSSLLKLFLQVSRCSLLFSVFMHQSWDFSVEVCPVTLISDGSKKSHWCCRGLEQISPEWATMACSLFGAEKSQSLTNLGRVFSMSPLPA